jgi:DNA-binding transcriptional LysR family regulator
MFTARASGHKRNNVMAGIPFWNRRSAGRLRIVMTNDLDLRRLRFFVQVVREGGFSAAAKALFSTQSTVSKAVKQLEGELGVVLLQRSSTRTDLTDEGKLVYDKAVQLLAAADRLRSELDPLKGLQRGQLAIGLPKMGTSAMLADVLATYKLKYPLIDLDVDVASVGELERRLCESEFDLAALFEPAPEGFEFRRVVEDELVVILPASHALSSRLSIDLPAMEGVPLFLCEPDIPAAKGVLDAFEARGIEPRVEARSSHLDVLYELVKSGAGASFVPRRLAAARSQGSTVARPLQGIHIPWRLGFGWPHGRHLSHAARALVDHVLPAGVSVQEVRN